MNQQPFDITTRKQILNSYFAQQREYQEIENRLLNESFDNRVKKSLEQRMEFLSDEMSNLATQYRNGLPVIPISRCPFCQSVIRHSVDTMGVDGLWWNYHAPTRGLDDQRCPHFLVLDGAVKLSNHVEYLPFSAILGPDAPFVIPRILEVNGVIAVMTSIHIGRHTGYPIVYFADPVPYELELTNTWGTSYYLSRGKELDKRGEHVVGWSESTCLEEDYDFELEQWIRNRKLQWIAPDDANQKLKSNIVECPFLNLSGHRKIQYLYFNEVTTADDDEDEAE